MKLALLILICVQSLHAGTNFTIQLGPATIAIATPPGYVEGGPERRKSFPANSPHALLGWFVRTNDLPLFDPGATNFLRHHLQVQTFKDWTGRTMSAETFAKFAGAAGNKNLGDMNTIASDVQKMLATADVGSKIEVAPPRQLGSLFRDTNAFGNLMLVGYAIPFTNGVKRVPMLVGNATVRIDGKCFFMYAYEYLEARNLQAASNKIVAVLKPWVDATLQANRK